MAELSKTQVMEFCRQRLHGHGVVSIQKSLLALVDHVDPHLAKDTYGQGEVIHRFEQRIAACLGKEAALFMPSGTMAQQIALRYWADRAGKNTVGMHRTSHLYEHEHHAYEKLHGLSAVLVGDPLRQMVPADLAALKTVPGSLILELPQRHNGGSLPEWDELLAMRAWTKERGVTFHLDGARLWEARTYYQRTEAEISALFDSVYVSFYKGLGGIGGAVLAGPRDLVEDAKIWQRRHGGNLIHLFPLVVAADLGFDKYRSRMEAYAARAKEIAKVFASTPHCRVTPKVPQVNMMHVTFDKPEAAVVQAALEASAETGVWILGALWTRGFDKENPVLELYVGEAAMEVGLERTEAVLRRFGERLGDKT